jgi:AraC family transcriptional regulator, transcriptional activator of pobA
LSLCKKGHSPHCAGIVLCWRKLDPESTVRFSAAMDASGKKLYAVGPVWADAGRATSGGIAWEKHTPGHIPGLSVDSVPSHFSALRWTLNAATARAHVHLVALAAGEAVIKFSNEDDSRLAGPVAAWLPAGCAEHVEIAPGSSAQVLRLKAGIWHRYLAPSAEPAYIKLMEATSPLAFPADLDAVATVARSMAAIAKELAEPAHLGAAAIISSELTLCVLRFWRLFPGGLAMEAAGSSAEVLRRFRLLVEERFQEHLPVSVYARLLGVTPDRLHSICARTLQRSPRELIHQRIVQEGVARLETSGATLKQIAFALGFKDTAYFNRFFRKHTGKPPGAWRRSQSSSRDASKTPLTFADWP